MLMKSWSISDFYIEPWGASDPILSDPNFVVSQVVSDCLLGEESSVGIL